MSFAADHGAAIAKLIAAQVPELQAAVLYGSRARGEAWHDSDVDIAVLAKQPLDDRLLCDMSRELEDFLHADVAIVDARRIPPTLAASLLEDALPLTVMDASALATWEAEAMTSYGLLNYERHALLKDFWNGQPVGMRAWTST